MGKLIGTKKFLWTGAGTLALCAALIGVLLFRAVTGNSIDAAWVPFDTYAKELAESDSFSGVALVAKDGDILLKQGYGQANKQTGTANTPETVFDIASMGKMFTGVAIAQLAEQGKLSFDDHLVKYNLGFPADIARQITIHQLLTHTAGLGDTALARKPGSTPPGTLAGQMAEIVAQPLQHAPGTQHSYSNDGYIVLGAVIEKVSGQSYADYINDHIFKPANMTHTGIRSYRPSEVPGMAHGYAKEANGLTDADVLEVANPSGGEYSTAGDLYNFARALMGNKLLSPHYTRIVTAGKVDTNRPGPASSDKYGYGFNERVINGVRIVGHNGGNPSYEAQLDMYPDTGYVVILLANQGGVRPVLQKAEDMLTK